MEVDKPLICRLCFEICKSNFEVVQSTTRDTLNFLLISLDLDVSKEPVMCNSCVNNLSKCFKFKTTCLHKMGDAPIKRENVDLNVPSVCLSEIVVNAQEALNCYNVCCSCAKPINSETSVLLMNEEMSVTTMLEKYIPELILNSTMNSMCMACYKSLQNHLAFISNCMAVEEKIKEYCLVEGTNSNGHVDLSSVLYFNSKNQLQNNIYSSFSVVKMEQSCEDTKIEDEFKINNDLIEMEEPGIHRMEKEDIALKTEDGGDGGFNAYTMHTPKGLELQMPNQKTTSEATISFKCRRCTYQSRCKNKLSNHACTHKSTSGVPTYKCKLCTYKSTRKDNLSRHMITHKQPSETTMYECEVCPYLTRHKNSLVQHMLIHRNPLELTLYRCEVCSYQARRKGNLSEHMLTHKDPSKIVMYKCEICPYQSRRKRHLPRHMLTHKYPSEVTTYKCEICTYESKAKWNLSEHVLTHKDPSEVVMHKCEICTYQSKHNRNLSKHMLTHKDPSEVVMYKCEMCAYQSKRKYCLSRHMLAHKLPSEITVYQCETCTFQTKRKTSLKVHMLGHRNESEVRMYKCDTCSFETRQKGNLKLHDLIHKTTSEVQMHKCKMCAFETKYKASLQLHVRRHKESSK